MNSVCRIQVLEQRAGRILAERGYVPVIVSHFVRSSNYIPFNLTARRVRSSDMAETRMVKLKIALHPVSVPEEAALFCRGEVACVTKLIGNLGKDGEHVRFEVWLALPGGGFQFLEISREGIREIADKSTGLQEGRT